MASKRLQEPWQKRVRAQIKAIEISAEEIRAKVGAENASTVRHWLNGTRRIKLDDFMALCAAVQIDPAVALFGGPAMTDEHVAALRQLTSTLPLLPAPVPAIKRLPPPKRRGDGEDESPVTK